MDQQINPPSNWQDFESLCSDLWKKIWEDPNAKRYGRAGQEQFGVDTAGNIKSIGDTVGLQCKSQDSYPHGNVTLSEIKKEILKAETFEPSLKQYTIATSGPRDAVLEAEVKKISEERKRHGTFPVFIWFWPDIEQELKKHDDLIARYYPKLDPKLEERITATMRQVLDEAKTNSISPAALDALFESIECLISDGRSNNALKFISDLEQHAWKNLDDQNKYKLLRLKGLAHLNSFQNAEGARAFIEALQYNPAFDKAHSNAALGYSLQGNKEKVMHHAREAIKINPENIRGHCLLVEHLPDDEIESFIKGAPEAVQKHPDFPQAKARRAKGNFPEVEKWLRAAIELDPEGTVQAKSWLAETLILHAMRGRPYAEKEELTKEEIAMLEEAKKLLEETDETIQHFDNRKLVLMTKQNLSMLSSSLGNHEEALRRIEEYLKMDPENNNLQMRRIELLRHLNRTEEAKTILQKLVKPGKPGKETLMLADILRTDGELDEAARLAEEFLKTDQPSEAQQDANGVLVQSYIDGGRFKEAADRLQLLLKKNPADIRCLLDAAEVEKAQGNIDASMAYVQTADKALKPDSSFLDVRRVADGYYSLGKFKEASALYERLTDKKTPTNTLQKLLHCYYKIGKHKEALAICQTVREAKGYFRFVAEVEADIYERISNLPKAQEILAEYIGHHPEDAHLTVRLAILYARAGEFEKIDALLKGITNVSSLSIEDAYFLARLYIERGKPNKGLSIAYETRRRFAKKPEAHLNYITLFIGIEDKSIIERPDTVGQDCVVFVENGAGGQDTYIIEEQERDGPDNREISVDDPRARQMKGKKVGDSFILVSSSWGKETAKITGITSKYIYAYQQSGSEYARMQPDNPAFTTIPADDGQTKDGELPTSLQTILKLAERREAQSEKLEELYLQKKMPLAMVAEQFGSDAIEIWSGYVANPSMKIVCCIGDNAELNFSGECFRGKDGKTSDLIPVIDITALLTLNHLGAEKYLKPIFPKIGIAQTTKDLIDNKIRELKSRPPSGYIGKNGYVTVKPESIAEEIKKLQAILDWVNEHCDVLPVNAALELPEGRREKLNDLLGEEFVDTILIASEAGRCLYSDDFLLRVLTKNEFGVRGFWTQLMLMRAEKLKTIEKEEYGRMSLELLKLGYDYTSVNENVLMCAAEEARWLPNEPYTKLLDVLKTAETGSALRMATEFIFSLMHQPLLTPFLRENLIIAFLNAITENQANLDSFIKQLISMLTRRFALSPILLNETVSIIIQWQEARLR